MNVVARHRWVHVPLRDRAAVVASCADASLQEHVATWLASDRPLIARACQPGEGDRLQPLGLCLPRAHGKRRVALSMPASAAARVEDAASLHAVASVLPPASAAVARELAQQARGLGFEARAFGSAAWQWRTGEEYLDDASDLDLLAAPGTRAALVQWIALLARLDAASPARLDGEIESPRGDAVNWRELAGGAAQVLVKSSRGARLAAFDTMWNQFP
jgi:phosphoribosyl-dephospho-CoA transferase